MLLTTIKDYEGLKLEADVSFGSKIVAIVGRNGAGKTRLLRAISQGMIAVSQNGEQFSQNQIRHLPMDGLQPSLAFGFDRVRHQQDLHRAATFYSDHRGKFDVDPQKTVTAIGHHPLSPHGTKVTVQLVAEIAARASLALGKDVNALDQNDITDYFSAALTMPLGALNVTEVMLSYWDRSEKNDYNEFRNTKYGTALPHFTPPEFLARFGPPPWTVLNEFLRDILDGRYHIKPPTIETIGNYEATLFRADDQPIDPKSLASGERVLLWLCLSIYASHTGITANPPKLLLLDEPDAALHPQMIQKMHQALRVIADRFAFNILFTTHSPTTVALFDYEIFQASERNLVRLEKDAAISELLVGVEQVSIHYTNRRQVYVESHKDAEIYSELFRLLKLWKKTASPYISAAFIPAAPKLPPNSIRKLINSHIGEIAPELIERFIDALNGQGNCARVIAEVERLVDEGSKTVHGIIDWDTKNKPAHHVHVLGEHLFYNIENALLNPLTLGLYLMHNYPNKIEAKDYGLTDGFDSLTLYSDVEKWQTIADGVTKIVLNADTVSHDLDCHFLSNVTVRFDRRYMHMPGHPLEKRVRDTYSFLNSHKNRLLMELVSGGIQPCQGRSLPTAFVDLFGAIQSSS